MKLYPEVHNGAKVADDVKAPRGKEALVQAGRTLNPKTIEKLVEAGVTKIPVKAEALVGRRTGGRVVDSETGEVLVETNQEITATLLAQIMGRRGGPLQAAGPGAGQDGRARCTRRWRATTSRTRTRRWWRSTGGCARAIRPRWSRPARCSAACSSTRAATTWPGSAAS